MKEFTIPGTPIAKPRQTQRDKWQKRPSVMRYRAWADEARLRAGKLPADVLIVSVRFHLPMPAGWKADHQQALRGQFHNARPDVDNMLKAVLDALWPTGDHKIAHVEAAKFWADATDARTVVRIN